MLRVSGITVELNKNFEGALICGVARKLGIEPRDIASCKLIKKAVDARKKSRVHFVCTADVTVGINEETVLKRCKGGEVRPVPGTVYCLPERTKHRGLRPVVCGMGPAGLFAGLILAKAGLEPVLLERGRDIDTRSREVSQFWAGAALDEESNALFGEGGAGTFSDGKLTTGISDIRCRFVLEEFVRCGAPEEILYLAKPHIGTDLLREVVKNIRRGIERMGGEIRFQTKLAGIGMKDGELQSIELQSGGQVNRLDCQMLILATGHSARDTYAMLHGCGIAMEQKPFAIGLRIEHEQRWLDAQQYGAFAGHHALGAADYKLAVHLPDGRSVYTFCMCPGGQVVAAASERGGVVVNGMSLHARDEKNANSALLCEVNPSDFGSDEALAGIEFQRKWERAAFEAGGANYCAPACRVEDFLRGTISESWGRIEPTYRPGVRFANLNTCLPDFVSSSLRSAIPLLDRKLPGFAEPDSVLTGVETRSSAPVRILRGQDMCSPAARGLYPCGEGAGYAGGIMSAAVDGIRAAEAVIASI